MKGIEKQKKYKLILNLILIICFLALIAFVSIKFGPAITKLARKPDQLREMLNAYGWKGSAVFMLLQVVQVVVAVIPGELVQLAGGYIYGIWLGTLYSLIGIVAGSIIVFYVARLLGYSLVKTFVSKKNLEKFDFMMNSNKSELAMFVLFLIPGVPKDILTYIAGLTPIKPLRFFITITVARFPALLASSIIGYNTQKGNYLVAVIISAAALALFVTGLFFKDRIISMVQHFNRAKKD